MEVIEYAAAQAAGFGVKFLFVVQNLPQIEDLYEKCWQTFLGNSGLKLFFQIDDDFTRSYLSRQLGELETTRQTRSGSQLEVTSDSTTRGTSSTDNTGRSTSRRPLLHFRTSKQESWGHSSGTTFSRSLGRSNSTTDGWGEAIHKRYLLNPDEIGRMLARIDDRDRPGYPGLVLALIPGEHPLLARRVNYFESPRFLGYFDPHPNHPPPPTLAELAAQPRIGGSVTQSGIDWDFVREQIGGLTRSVGWFVEQVFGLAILVGICFGGYRLYEHRTSLLAALTRSAATPTAASAGRVTGQTGDPSFSTSVDTAPAASTAPPPSAAYAKGVADWDSLKA
jgi:hypothetical protein